MEDHLVGFLALGPKLSGAGYLPDDLHAFTTLAHEAALAIDNALSYEELLRVNEQLKVAAERLLTQERLAAAGQFATGMAHEIKNPLSAIKTFAQYLPEKYDDPAFRKKFFRIVQAEIDRINEIVRELSDFAKPAPLQLQPVKVAQLVEDTLSLLSNQCLEHGVEIEKHFLENGVKIQADPQQLKQVLLNLLLNSLEAMPQGGKIEVTTATGQEGLSLRITDTGTGISPDQQKHVWDPFFTTKERGMGLGLAIVKGVVERHGGQIALSSRPGQGTTVEVNLPI
jgi:signal transduction histidine kinase